MSCFSSFLKGLPTSFSGPALPRGVIRKWIPYQTHRNITQRTTSPIWIPDTRPSVFILSWIPCYQPLALYIHYYAGSPHGTSREPLVHFLRGEQKRCGLNFDQLLLRYSRSRNIKALCCKNILILSETSCCVLVWHVRKLQYKSFHHYFFVFGSNFRIKSAPGIREKHTLTKRNTIARFHGFHSKCVHDWLPSPNWILQELRN